MKKSTQQGKSKPAIKAARSGPSALARKVGVSQQLASRKLAQGKSPDQIKSEAELHRIVLAKRAERVNGSTPSFADSQAKKEHALSLLKQHELQLKRGSVAPVANLQNWTAECIVHVRDRVMGMAIELGDGLAALQTGQECTMLLDRTIKSILTDASQRMWRRARFYKLQMPPPLPPPPPPAQLASYQRFVRGLMDGTLESVPRNEQYGSQEWAREHPSVSVQQTFELAAKKRAWDAEMSALLSRRSEWDLPPESGSASGESEGDGDETGN